MEFVSLSARIVCDCPDVSQGPYCCSRGAAKHGKTSDVRGAAGSGRPYQVARCRKPTRAANRCKPGWILCEPSNTYKFISKICRPSRCFTPEVSAEHGDAFSQWSPGLPLMFFVHLTAGVADERGRRALKKSQVRHFLCALLRFVTKLRTRKKRKSFQL